MSLSDYNRKRRFDKTSEPKGKADAAPAGRQFVIQLHAARRLHVDLRLELDGVLKSWAVPKGISLDPAERRLAVHVEDHPMEYATFEGMIPEGQYGAGSVIVWDNGDWEPIGDAQASYAAGKLKFRLRGQKLQGAWMLVRMRPRPEDRGDNWLLIKERDEFAVPGERGEIVRDRPESVLSGRTLAEVSAGVEAGPSRESADAADGILALLRRTPGAQNANLPAAIDPALGRLATEPPVGDGWLHEIKLDGYRLLAWLEHGKAQLRTRQGNDWTHRFPEIAAAIERLPVNLAVLDGEICAVSPEGVSSISALQQAHKRGTASLIYYIFDVLHLEGFDLRQVDQETRKEILRKLLAQARNSRLRYVDHVIGDGASFLDRCRRLGLEGIMSKRRKASYRSGRSDNWLKIKCVQREPFVIGGYTTATGVSRMRALIVGYHDERGRLVYAGRVGSGFTEQMAADLQRRLSALERPDSPFADPVPKESGRIFHWARPVIVAQVRYAGWTPEGILWHPTFEALREDADPADIIRESPIEPVPAEAEAPPPPPSRKSSRRASKSAAAPLPQKLLDELSDVRLTTPQKVLYPDVGLTKLDLVRYYVQIADWILPHVIDRPLSLVRCPEGQLKECFFQKHAGPETPKAVQRIKIQSGDETDEDLYIRDLPGLVSLVQVSTLEIHVWGARVDNPERPDRMVVDFDPDEAVPFVRVIEAAYRVRERLRDAGLTSFVKTTGGKGLHVVVPLERRQTWDELKEVSQRLAQGMAEDYPQSYTANMSKRARSGKIYIDYARNNRGATAVAPYSTRARPGAPVATPVAWDELTPNLRPDAFTVLNLADRLSGLSADPWGDMARVRQALTATIRKKLH